MPLDEKTLADVDNIATAAISNSCGVATDDLEMLRRGEPFVEGGFADMGVAIRIMIKLVQRIAEMDARLKDLERVQ